MNGQKSTSDLQIYIRIIPIAVILYGHYYLLTIDCYSKFITLTLVKRIGIAFAHIFLDSLKVFRFLSNICRKWPEKHLIPTDLLPHYTHRSDITFCECNLLKNERIIVPTTLRAEMKSLIHQGHLGIENCKKRARQSLFWRLMNSEIEDIIKKCPTSLTFRNRQPSEPIINHPISNQAWTKTAVDLFHLYEHYYLLMIDYYSKFIYIYSNKTYWNCLFHHQLTFFRIFGRAFVYNR